ncbi:probable serine carboxypeptidase CPVL [Sycon ciliatum]|uniref:probable serine carboxypeptidase CPVL n=1 Tax=Sycon ciliatum TaxID=27933 RepID=UPI0020AA2897|eukprot:scpid68963/ scgid35577/ Probable serine carboxypeptidase CPVL; Carboxypeptidase, vitellogenic-like; Vitellogenic carboxypeptidase-like protein
MSSCRPSVLLAIALLASFSANCLAFRENWCSEEVHGGKRTGGAFRSFLPHDWKTCGDGSAGDPLFLTPLLKNGSIAEAVELSAVHGVGGVTSYSGYLTVNEQYSSNMFFWFFPAQENPEDAPVLMWLQGGPGATSMYGLFVELGPLKATASGNIEDMPITWNKKYSLLFVDNPVGTGFSFTSNDAGYAKNQDDVARDLYSALTQFFSIYTKFAKNDFYVTGESYAGKYVPSISAKIVEENAQKEKPLINFKGMAIGDGLTDPLSMNKYYANLMLQTSLIDTFQASHVSEVAQNMTKAIRARQFVSAFHMFDDLLNGDLIKYPSWYKNVTGTTNYFNILRSTSPADSSYFVTALNRDEVRKAIHVGNLPFHMGNTVEIHLLADVQDSALEQFLTVLKSDKNYKVMVYNGQLDIIVGVPLTEGMVSEMDWAGKEKFYNAARKIWKVNSTDAEVAGYVRSVLNLMQVVVRGAGHMVPHDQPVRALDLISRFVDDFKPE